MHRVKYSARGVHAAHQKKKNIARRLHVVSQKKKEQFRQIKCQILCLNAMNLLNSYNIHLQ